MYYKKKVKKFDKEYNVDKEYVRSILIFKAYIYIVYIVYIYTSLRVLSIYMVW